MDDDKIEAKLPLVESGQAGQSAPASVGIGDSPSTPLDEWVDDACDEAEGEDGEAGNNIFRWFGNVFIGGLIQAVVILMVAGFLNEIAFAFLPILTFAKGTIFFDFIKMLFMMAVGCGIAGNVFPQFSFWRGGICFLWAITYDAVNIRYLDGAFGIFGWVETEASLIAGLTCAGMFVCSATSAIGCRIRHGFKRWVSEEFAEFFESIGVLPEDHALHSSNSDK
ncbi:MAG: hypothetical protein JXR97_01125 [Planctomycetes bacterium]|nr:hypothetical protein [Planctomycetota bacterium]